MRREDLIEEFKTHTEKGKDAKKRYNTALDELEDISKTLSSLINEATEKDLLDKEEAVEFSKLLKRREFEAAQDLFINEISESTEKIETDGGKTSKTSKEKESKIQLYQCQKCKRKFKKDQLTERCKTFDCPKCGFVVLRKGGST